MSIGLHESYFLKTLQYMDNQSNAIHLLLNSSNPK